VIARRICSDAVPWLMTTEGWVAERVTHSVSTSAKDRVLIPCIHGQPHKVVVVSTRFSDCETAGLRASYTGKSTTCLLFFTTNNVILYSAVTFRTQYFPSITIWLDGISCIGS
jgi:hypothetical protein